MGDMKGCITVQHNNNDALNRVMKGLAHDRSLRPANGVGGQDSVSSEVPREELNFQEREVNH